MQSRYVKPCVAGPLFLVWSILGNAAEAPDPTKWEKDIQQFAEQDLRAPPPEHAILFVGSSSIRLWDTAECFREWASINRGFGGSQIADVNHYFDRIVQPYAPRIIVFYAGDNDIAADKSARDVAEDFSVFLQRVRGGLSDTHVVFLGIKPSIARWEMWDRMREANQRIEQLLAKDPRGHFVDTAASLLGPDGRPDPRWYVADGLHLSAAGYQQWTDVLRQVLVRLAPPRCSRNFLGAEGRQHVRRRNRQPCNAVRRGRAAIPSVLPAPTPPTAEGPRRSTSAPTAFRARANPLDNSGPGSARILLFAATGNWTTSCESSGGGPIAGRRDFARPGV